MVIYVDGDNCPGKRLTSEDLAKLKETDVVKVFYARNNNHYTQGKKQEELRTNCKCSLTLMPVKAGTNSVDFAIALHLSKDLAQHDNEDAYFIVSGDTDFDLIIEHVKELSQGVFIKRIETVEEAIARFFLFGVTDKESLKNALDGQFGTTLAENLYNRLSSVFQEKTTGDSFKTKKHNFTDNLFNRWRISKQ